ncbi:MAG TPA: sugar phosphate isomerase/epimerase family protein [Vicinamibacterales bacterium]|nr:sugar phosphate isomerase/epimerase family protein [Vicinamibacterales bacterium]
MERAQAARSSRREFLDNALAGVAGVALSGTTMAAQRRDAVDGEKGVQIAIATIALDGFGDEYFEQAFRLVPQIGIKNVEFNVWFPRTVTPGGIAHIQEGCYRQGLKPVCLQGTAFGGNVVKDVAHKIWLMEQIKGLGGRRVKFTGARRGDDGGLDTVIATLKAIAPAAEELDVLVLVENHANNNIETIDDYDRIFAAVPSRHVGMCLDMAHFDGANVDNFAVIERFHERILHIDMKDTAARGVHKVVNYGSGVTDVHGIVKKALERGYSGYLVIEQAPPLSRETLVADMTRAFGMFKSYERGLATGAV